NQVATGIEELASPQDRSQRPQSVSQNVRMAWTRHRGPGEDFLRRRELKPKRTEPTEDKKSPLNNNAASTFCAAPAHCRLPSYPLGRWERREIGVRQAKPLARWQASGAT